MSVTSGPHTLSEIHFTQEMQFYTEKVLAIFLAEYFVLHKSYARTGRPLLLINT